MTKQSIKTLINAISFVACLLGAISLALCEIVPLNPNIPEQYYNILKGLLAFGHGFICTVLGVIAYNRAKIK